MSDKVHGNGNGNGNGKGKIELSYSEFDILRKDLRFIRDLTQKNADDIETIKESIPEIKTIIAEFKAWKEQFESFFKKK